jgi:hypothetical protein
MSHQLHCVKCNKKYGKDDFSAKERKKEYDLSCLRHSTSSSYGQNAITHNPIRTYDGIKKYTFTTKCNICFTTLPRKENVYVVQYTDPLSENAYTNCNYCYNCYIQSQEHISDTDDDGDDDDDDDDDNGDDDNDDGDDDDNDDGDDDVNSDDDGNDNGDEADDVNSDDDGDGNSDATENSGWDEDNSSTNNKKRKYTVIHDTDDSENEQPSQNN